jgi:hypothetical protein
MTYYANARKIENMNQYPYAMMYYDKTCQTLNEGIRKMNAIPNPVYCYQHTIYANNTHSDLSYASYITHVVASEMIILTFPKECKWIANLRNNYNYKMVLQCKNVHTYLNQGTSLSEIVVTPEMNIDTRAENDIKIMIYTRGNKHLEIYFDMYLMKPIKCKL